MPESIIHVEEEVRDMWGTCAEQAELPIVLKLHESNALIRNSLAAGQRGDILVV